MKAEFNVRHKLEYRDDGLFYIDGEPCRDFGHNGSLLAAIAKVRELTGMGHDEAKALCKSVIPPSFKQGEVVVWKNSYNVTLYGQYMCESLVPDRSNVLYNSHATTMYTSSLRKLTDAEKGL